MSISRPDILVTRARPLGFSPFPILTTSSGHIRPILAVPRRHMTRVDVPNLLAWQGCLHDLPPGWEPVGMYGSWRKGQVIIAEDRRPRVAIAWERRAMTPVLERTANTVAKAHRRAVGASQVSPPEPCGPDGVVVRLVGGPTEIAIGVRRVAQAQATIVYRQLSPGPMVEFRRLIMATTAVADDEAATWSIHGLRVDLPPYWRTEGIQVLAGFVRGVWFHYPHGKERVDSVLILRRYACASHLLAGRDLVTWLTSQAEKQEVTTVHDTTATSAHLTLTGPGRTWWRRLRRRPQVRHLYAWVDSESDRLTVQETTGDGEPLAGLRARVGSPRCAFLSTQEATGMP